MDFDGVPVSDTAGIRETSDEIESRGVKLAINRPEVDLNIIILDPKTLDFRAFFNNKISNKSIAINKDLEPIIMKDIDAVSISIKADRNVDKLIEKIKLKLKNTFKNKNVLITRSRHRHI